MGKKSKKKSKKSEKWSSSESSEGEFEWVEKKDDKSCKPQVKGPMMPPTDVNISEIAKEQEEQLRSKNDWLGGQNAENLFGSLGKNYQKGSDKRQEDRRMANEALMAVQAERELNPYLKQNCDTVALPPPTTKSSQAPVVQKISGDGGLSWWTRALDNCKQMAQDQARSLEEVAAERYGSLESLMAKIQAAKDIVEANNPKGSRDTKFYRPGQSTTRNYSSNDRDYNRRDQEARQNWRRRDDDKSASSNYSDRRNDNGRNSNYDGDRQEKHKRPQSTNQPQKAESTKKRRSSSSSSSSSSTDSEPAVKSKSPEKVEAPPKVDDFLQKYGNKDLNEIGAAIIKAELFGDDELVSKLKNLQNDKASGKIAVPSATTTNKQKQEILIATKTDRFGNEIPLTRHELEQGKQDEHGHDRKRNKKAKNSYKDGERQTYFADDNKYSLKDLVEKEKNIGVDDNNLMYSSIKPKLASKLTQDDMDDDILDNAINKQLDGWSKIKVLAEQRSKTEALNKCEMCVENAKKHLIISLGTKSYLSLPDTVSLVDGHCYIVPIQHYISSVMVDEDVWSEMQQFRKAIVAMLKQRSMDCIFVEQFSNEKSFQHMYIECIPISYDAGEMAPMYFKKALLESEKDWSASNKPIIDLRGKGVRNSLPKGLPYFAVDFGLDDGFAHIIENKQAFPEYFAKEIIGGIMDLDPYLWRKPRKEKFSEHSKKVIDFLKFWKNFEFNQQQRA